MTMEEDEALSATVTTTASATGTTNAAAASSSTNNSSIISSSTSSVATKTYAVVAPIQTADFVVSSTSEDDDELMLSSTTTTSGGRSGAHHHHHHRNSNSSAAAAASSTSGQSGGAGDVRLAFSQVKGSLEDDVADGGQPMIHFISLLSPFPPQGQTASFSHSGSRRGSSWSCSSSSRQQQRASVITHSSSSSQPLPLPPPTGSSDAMSTDVGSFSSSFSLPKTRAADIISCVEFSPDGELLATGDKGGRVVIFQRDSALDKVGKRSVEYSFYSTFQSHEAEFDYLKSLEIEEKINKIRWLKQKNAANFLLSTNDKTIKLWKIAERDKRFDGFNLKDDAGGQLRLVAPDSITSLRVPRTVPTKLVVEPTPRRIFANAHTYLINSISVNSDQETYLSADDLRINLWNIEINDESFNIVDIKPANMEELTEVITAAEFHPHHCNYLVYSSSKGILRLCDMRAAALCDRHAKIFEEPEDNSFFSEIISSISGIKFSNNGRYLISRDYMSIKVWDINMESRPVETYQVHEYLRSKLCSLFESDYIFDKFECSINGSDTHLMTGSYNNFFKIFDRRTKRDVMYEATKEIASSLSGLKPRKVFSSSTTTTSAVTLAGSTKKKKDEMNVDSLDFTSKILHTAWHPSDNIIAVAATNNLFLFKECSEQPQGVLQQQQQQPVPMEAE